MSKETETIKPIVLDTKESIAEHYLNQDFACVSKDVLCVEEGEFLSEGFIPIPPSDEYLFEERGDGYFDNFEELTKQLQEDKITIEDITEMKEWEGLIEDEMSSHYPMWNYVFLAKSVYTTEDIVAKVDELYSIGLGVFEHKEETGIFVPGAGYNFYDKHWIPLYENILPSPINRRAIN